MFFLFQDIPEYSRKFQDFFFFFLRVKLLTLLNLHFWTLTLREHPLQLPSNEFLRIWNRRKEIVKMKVSRKVAWRDDQATQKLLERDGISHSMSIIESRKPDEKRKRKKKKEGKGGRRDGGPGAREVKNKGTPGIIMKGRWKIIYWHKRSLTSILFTFSP